MNKLKDILTGFTPSKIVSESAGNVVASIMNGADKLFTSKDELNEFKLKLESEINKHTEAVQNADLEETKAYLADSTNARDTNTKIQESEHASWLAKNVGYILDIVFTTGFILMFALILFHKVPLENKEIFYTGFGLLGGYVSTILGFHRGTSQGSQKYGETVRNMVKNK